MRVRVCYLCGGELGSDSNKDHVPPKQLFPMPLRAEMPNLITLRTHVRCNSEYERDESYFTVNCVGQVVSRSPTGKVLLAHAHRRLEREHDEGFRNQLLGEVRHIAGLPGDLVAAELDMHRVTRVLWKITRGLWFHKFGAVLPEPLPFVPAIHSPYQPPPARLLPILRSRKGRPGPEDALAFDVHAVPELKSGFLALVIHQHFMATGVFALDSGDLPAWADRSPQ